MRFTRSSRHAAGIGQREAVGQRKRFWAECVTRKSLGGWRWRWRLRGHFNFVAADKKGTRRFPFCRWLCFCRGRRVRHHGCEIGILPLFSHQHNLRGVGLHDIRQKLAILFILLGRQPIRAHLQPAHVKQRALLLHNGSSLISAE